jgi:hypothetical protein
MIIRMKTIKFYSLALIAFTILSVNVLAQESKDKRPPKEKWSFVTMRGTVTEIVKENRAITLMGSKGDLITFTADESVERFDEITVDDVLTIDYYTYMMAEFRKPTAQEIAEPLIVIAEAGKAPEGMDPAAVVGAVVKAVVTIEALNRPFMMATVKGPAGNFLTIDMEDAELITELNIGQVLILYYAEATAISLTKVD